MFVEVDHREEVWALSLLIASPDVQGCFTLMVILVEIVGRMRLCEATAR